jgi:S-(hydroxymethyl)glutathione dehydrogenase/alcohol dehydrogenase
VRAAIFVGQDQPPSVEDVTPVDPGPGDVVVRIGASGVCHSDLSVLNGTLPVPPPVVLGHEGAGTVVAAGPGVTSVAPGDRVVLNWAPSCGECWWCTAGEPYLCARSGDASDVPYARTTDGVELFPGLGTAAFATETVVAARACIPVPDDLPLREAALLGCAVLTGVGAVRNAAGVRAGQSVAVIGLGGVGLAALQGARIAGADPIIAVDPALDKEELALRLGATHVLAPSDGLAKEIRALTGGRGVDHAIECVGRSSTIRTAWSVTRRGGRATVVGLGSAADPVQFNALEVAFFARTLAGCMYGSTDPALDVPRLVEHWRAGRLDLSALVTDHIGLSDVDAAFDRMRAGKGGRSLILLQ